MKKKREMMRSTKSSTAKNKPFFINKKVEKNGCSILQLQRLCMHACVCVCAYVCNSFVLMCVHGFVWKMRSILK